MVRIRKTNYPNSSFFFLIFLNRKYIKKRAEVAIDEKPDRSTGVRRDRREWSGEI